MRPAAEFIDSSNRGRSNPFESFDWVRGTLWMWTFVWFGGVGQASDTYVLASRTFSIPFTVDVDAPGDATRVELLVTEERYETASVAKLPWRTAATLAADAGRPFSYTVDNDGEYWFTTRTIGWGGVGSEPLATSNDGVLKIIVDTTPPRIDVMVDANGDGGVEARWKVSDETRTDEPVVRYATDRMKSWRVVPSGAKDRVQFMPDGDWDQIAVHVSIRDAAGNQGGGQRIVRRPRVAERPLRRLAVAPGRSRFDGPFSYYDPGTAKSPFDSSDHRRTPATVPAVAPSSDLPIASERRWQSVGLPGSAADAIAVMQRSGGNGIGQTIGNVSPVFPSAGPPETRSPNIVQAGDRTGETEPASTAEADGTFEWVPPAGRRRIDSGMRPSPGELQADDAEDDPSLQIHADAKDVPTRDRKTMDRGAITAEEFRGVRPPVENPVEAFRPIDPSSVRDGFPPVNGGSPRSTRQGASAKGRAREGRSEEERTDETAPSVVSDGGSRRIDATVGEITDDRFDRVSHRYSDSRRFSLDYEVEMVSSRGVEAIELYGTTDRGRSWSLWGRDPDQTSPFDIETREAGTFGYRIVVVASGGLASPRPLAGDEPDIVVVVDDTPPKVAIRRVGYGQGSEAGSLVVDFVADDKHFDRRPINLSIAEDRSGPWTTIGGGLRNTGRYVWPADPALPRSFYLRIDATDRAGNVSTEVLDEPIDARGFAPRARIQGFRPL